MVRVNTSINHKSRFCVILVFAGFAGFAALLLGAMPVHAQQGLLNRTLVPADSSQNGLISDIVDDRAIKQLISSKAELLLPDPEVSLLEGFEEQIKRSETKLKLPKLKSAILASHEVYPAVAPSVLVLSKVY